MEYKLTLADRNAIWNIVHHAAESVGGYQNLFSAPLEFIENGDRVKFNWPVWMRAIKFYIVSQYGEKSLDKLLVEILAEVYSPAKYQQYVNHIELENQYRPKPISGF